MSLPHLALIATGGTIAGRGSLSNYTAGVLTARELLEAVPELVDLANWRVEQIFAIDSRDMTPAHWLLLARSILAQLERTPLTGIVVTHGTDTLEETAFALHWLLPTGIPVILTAAMRPAISPSADGPMNLLQATRVAAHSNSAGRGVLVVGNDRIIAGNRVTKAHTYMTDAVAAQEGGLEGAVIDTEVVFHRPSPGARGCLLELPDAATLPRVDIVTIAAGQDPDQIEWAVSRGASGIVLALPGHGSVPQAFLPALEAARKRNLVIVRASRVGRGMVVRNHNAEDDAHGWIAAGHCTPWQARALLILALAAGHSFAQIAELFYERAAAITVP